MNNPHRWRVLRHPLRMTTRKGWTWGRRCVISPRGTVFETRFWKAAALARKRFDWQLDF